MTPQELKNSILQLAIQGKLVEQRANEGTGAELLEKILAAKDAKGKGEKSHAKSAKSAKVGSRVSREEIPDDEKPFDIPESWEWVRLGEIGSWASGATPSRTHSEYYGGSIPWLKTGDLTDGYVSSIPEFITDLALEKNSVRLNPVGSVLMAMYGATIGKLGILQIAATTNQACCACIPYDGVWNKYLFYYLMARRKAFIKMGEGGAQPNISKEKIVNVLIPLPPLAEQKRIVAKIEELLPLIDCYEKAWSRLEDFNKRFPVDMQKSLLQMAIQGKLVEQRAEEGTGEELYRQIQVERERLIRNGAVKAEKPFDPISDDEKPFEIPENWTWVRFGNLGSYKKGPFGSALTKSIFVTKGADSVKVYEQKNAIQKDATLGEYYIRRDYFETKMSGFEVHSGDVIVSCAGTIGETYVLPEGIEQGIINQALMRMKIFVPMYVPYFLLFFDVVLKQSARANSKGSAIKNIPPFEILKNYLVPLPPLAEQKRIVAKIEELLPLIDRYEKAWSKFDFKR